ncbi:DHH family phosphoesterase [Saccharopolyspora montiporae]|uniref:DHH family phosphoesterase n=1 Tax=Saccharopolyspora montiporae TaxID=2781240 RepID=UPI00351C4127
MLSAAPDVTLFAHVNPDADALGSALALGRVLQRQGAVVRVAFGAPAEPAEALRALDTDGLLVPVHQVPATPSALVVCDTGSLERLGPLADRVAATAGAGGPVVVLDHHVGNPRYGTVNIIDERAEATALLALRLVDELGGELDRQVARCLYAGLATDTRSFRAAGVQAYRVAARLLSTGIDPDAILRPLLDDHPFTWLGVLSEVLADAHLEPDAAAGLGLVHAAVPWSAMCRVRGEDVDSVIDLLRTTSEAEVAAVLKETAPGIWSVSLRADSRVDVGRAATACGGGGHRLASGFTSRAEPAVILRELRAALAEG